MSLYRVLVAWIGHTDIRAMAESVPEAERERLLKTLPKAGPVEKPGPIRALLDRERFDEIHLLSTYPRDCAAAYAKWLPVKVRIHEVNLPRPTDYPAVFNAADAVLAGLAPGWRKKSAELCFHLSPGTPAMAAIWVLLGKSRYPATFYQTHKGGAQVTDIPFDLAVDFVPQLLRDPDAHFLHLASARPSEIRGFEQIVGESRSLRLAVGRARQAAIRQVTILLQGESGTGKEMFARAIHAASSRSNGPFVAVNCAAMPKELLESELFGHKKGAFSGAVADRDGAFDASNGGTLFLDEIGECDPAMQAKLLRVLQRPPGKGPCDRVYCRLGETKERTSSVRVIAATNRDLVESINRHEFREDLYYRLAAITIKLPPLRQRKSDIPLLAEALLDQINTEFAKEEPGYKYKTLSPAAMDFVSRYDWPGNVRQLYNALVQAAVMAAGDVVGRSDVAAAVSGMPGNAVIDAMEQPLGDGFRLEEHLETVQKHYLRRAMQESGGVKTKAARLLGMKSYQALDAQLKRLKVVWGGRGS
jgi:DNA-binding NtrC family response regulator